MNLERRHDLRQSLDSLLYLDLEPNNGGIVLDLSETGMQISVAKPLVHAKQVRFSFCLEARSRVRGTGRIAWVSASGKSAGVHFLALPKETLEQIQKFLGQTAASDGGGVVPVQTAEPKPSPEVQTSAPPQESPADVPCSSPPLMSAAEPPASVLFLYDGEGIDEVPAPQADAPETEAKAAEKAGVEVPKTGLLTPAADSTGEQPPIRFFLDRFPHPAANAAPKTPNKKQAASSRTTGPARLPMSRPAARGRASGPDLVRVRPWLGGSAGSPSATASTGRSSDEPLPSGGPLYLPNYRVEENRGTGDAHISKFRPSFAPLLAAKLISERFEEFGWSLESDWHIWAALVLLLAGFFALVQTPPLPLLTIALWFAGAALMMGRKKSPREQAGRQKPGPQ